MTNWQHNIKASVGSLCAGEGADFGFAYVERRNTETFMVQTYGPLENLEFNFHDAIARVIEVASQAPPKGCRNCSCS